jgi:drug/metabolite transporter (DMT)-like permease
MVGQALMFAMRYVLPGVLILAGILALALGGDHKAEGFGLFVGAGVSLALMNILFRVGASGDRERDDEESAREYFSTHGHWPGEGPGPRR